MPTAAPIFRIDGDRGTGKTLTVVPMSGYSFAAGQWGRRLPTESVFTPIANATALTYQQAAGDDAYLISFMPTNPVQWGGVQVPPGPPQVTQNPVLNAITLGAAVTWSAGSSNGTNTHLLLKNGIPVTSVSNSHKADPGRYVVAMTVARPDGQKTEVRSNVIDLALVLPVDPVDSGLDIILEIYSSNMVGWDPTTTAADNPDPNVFQFGGRPSDLASYRQITQPGPYQMHPDSMNGIGPGLSLAKTYTAATGRKVLLVPCAYGGSSSVVGGAIRWGATSNNDATLNAIDQAKRAIVAARAQYPGSNFVGILASPGGNDEGATRAQFLPVFRAAMAMIKNGITNPDGSPAGANAWTIIFQQLPEKMNAVPIRKILDEAQKEFAASTPLTGFVTLGLGYPLGDGLHYTSVGQRLFGAIGYNQGLPQALARVATTAPGPTGTPTLNGVASSAAASFVWTYPSTGGVVSDFNVRYRIVGASTWTTLARATSTQAAAELAGLTAGSNYEAQAQASGPGGVSAWSASATFTTTGGAANPDIARMVIAPEQAATMTESGNATDGWSYGPTGQPASSANHIGFCDKKLPLGVASYVEMTVQNQINQTYPVLGLVPTFSDPLRNSGATGYKYSMWADWNNGGIWRPLSEGAATLITPVSNNTPQVGDKFRLETAADGTVTAKIARAATPTTWITVYEFPIKATTDLWPAFSCGDAVGNQGHRSGPLMVGTL